MDRMVKKRKILHTIFEQLDEKINPFRNKRRLERYIHSWKGEAGKSMRENEKSPRENNQDNGRKIRTPDMVEKKSDPDQKQYET